MLPPLCVCVCVRVCVCVCVRACLHACFGRGMQLQYCTLPPASGPGPTLSKQATKGLRLMGSATASAEHCVCDRGTPVENQHTPPQTRRVPSCTHLPCADTAPPAPHEPQRATCGRVLHDRDPPACDERSVTRYRTMQHMHMCTMETCTHPSSWRWRWRSMACMRRVARFLRWSRFIVLCALSSGFMSRSCSSRSRMDFASRLLKRVHSVPTSERGRHKPSLNFPRLALSSGHRHRKDDAALVGLAKKPALFPVRREAAASEHARCSDRRSGFWTGAQHIMLTVPSACQGEGLFRIAPDRSKQSAPATPQREHDGACAATPA